MRHIPYPVNFKYPEITEDHKAYTYGSANAGEVIRPNGDWRDYLPPEEEQNRHNVESSACYIEAQQHAIAVILEEEYAMPDLNFAARFNALLSGSTENGGDPLKGADSIRYDGLIPEGMMPFSEDILSWSDFHSWKGVKETLCRIAGKLWLKKWEPNNWIVFKREDSIQAKYIKLRDALKRSPVPMSVYAWIDDNDIYTKPEGLRDTHLTLCIHVDEKNRPYFFDTYPPFIKIGEPFYNSEFAMRWTVKKVTEPTVEINIIMKFIELLKRIGLIVLKGKIC